MSPFRETVYIVLAWRGKRGIAIFDMRVIALI